MLNDNEYKWNLIATNIQKENTLIKYLRSFTWHQL